MSRLHHPPLPDVAVDGHAGLDVGASVVYLDGYDTKAVPTNSPRRLINAIAQERTGGESARIRIHATVSVPHRGVDSEQ